MDAQALLDRIAEAAYREAVAWKREAPSRFARSQSIARDINALMDALCANGWDYDAAWNATEAAHARGWMLAND